MDDLLQWYLGQHVAENESVSRQRDIAKARIDSFRISLERKKVEPNEIALLIAVVGELVNNAFDHNLGKWHGVSGCYFRYESLSEQCLLVRIADRGQGIRNSLQVVSKKKLTDAAALKMAFEKRISGRSPKGVAMV